MDCAIEACPYPRLCATSGACRLADDGFPRAFPRQASRLSPLACLALLADCFGVLEVQP